MPFTTTMSTTTSLDNSLVQLFSEQAYFGAIAEEVADQFASTKEQINAKSITWSKYNDITVTTSALTEDEDVTSSELTDTELVVTPAEHGQSIVRTKLASLQSGGKVDRAAALAIGRAIGVKKDKLALAALSAGSPIGSVYAGTATTEATLAETDTAGKKFVSKMYNKLSRRNTPGHPMVGGLYVAIAHGDVISDIMEETGQGAWEDVMKYADPNSILRKAAGVYGGFAWFRDSNAAPSDGGGAGSVDSYKIFGFGDNVLVRADSEQIGIRITGPFDKLGRFLNVGYYGSLAYGVLDGNNMVHGYCASSFGENS